ncbi:hypothetical protein AK88_01521 [Plasmodium fragile]|uniref:Uncharacterized protein n=1 Tax=Plasmodium fragile TaxID=5857 RepID=A0A0D9QT59_PLAFR|nr:uncharacterized protein AK88_01521 [Plasmodium fragile]KJP88831.1 hypothetical protein AK88_01521 [Plasmodium fragile]
MNRRTSHSSYMNKEGEYKHHQVGEPKGSRNDIRNTSTERWIHAKGHNNERSQSGEPSLPKWNHATNSKRELMSRHNKKGGSQEMFAGSGQGPNENGDARMANGRTAHMQIRNGLSATTQTNAHGVRQPAHRGGPPHPGASMKNNQAEQEMTNQMAHQREVNIVLHHQKGGIEKSAYSKKHRQVMPRGKALVNVLQRPEGGPPGPSHTNSRDRDLSQESFQRTLPSSRLIQTAAPSSRLIQTAAPSSRLIQTAVPSSRLMRKEESTFSNPMLVLNTRGNKPTHTQSTSIKTRMIRENFLQKHKTTQNNFLERDTRQREQMGIPQQESFNKTIIEDYPTHFIHLNDRCSREGSIDQSHFLYMKNNATSKRLDITMQGKKHEQRRHEYMNHNKNTLQGDHLHHMKDRQQRDKLMHLHKQGASVKFPYGMYVKKSVGRNGNGHSEKITNGMIIDSNCIRAVHCRSRNMELMNTTHPQFGRRRVSQMENLVKRKSIRDEYRRGISSDATTNTCSESTVPVASSGSSESCESSEASSSGPDCASPLHIINADRRPFFINENPFLKTPLSIFSLKDPHKTTQTKSYISINKVHHKDMWNGSNDPFRGPRSCNPTQTSFATRPPYTSATQENIFNKKRDGINTRGGSNNLVFNLPNRSGDSHRGSRNNYSHHPHEHVQAIRHIRCEENDPFDGLNSEEFPFTCEKYKREVKPCARETKQERRPPSKDNQFATFGKHNREMCIRIDTSCVGGDVDASIRAIQTNAAHRVVAANAANVVKAANRNGLHPTGSLYNQNLLHLTHEKVKKGLTFDEMRRKSFEAMHVSQSPNPQIKYKQHDMRHVHDFSNYSIHEREERNKKNARRSVTQSSESLETNCLPKKRKLNGTEAMDRQNHIIIPPNGDPNMSYNKTVSHPEHGRNDKSMLRTNFRTEKTTTPLQITIKNIEKNEICDRTKRGQANLSTREENKKENCINILSQKKNNFKEKNVMKTCSGSYQKDPLPVLRKKFAVPPVLINKLNKQFNATVGSSCEDKRGNTNTELLYRRAAITQVSNLNAVGRNNGDIRQRSLSGNDEEKLNKEKWRKRVNNVPTWGSGAMLSKNCVANSKAPQVSSQKDVRNGASFVKASKSQQAKQSNDAQKDTQVVGVVSTNLRSAYAFAPGMGKFPVANDQSREDAHVEGESGPFCDIFNLNGLSNGMKTQKETSKDATQEAIVAHAPNPCNGAPLVKKTNRTKVPKNADDRPGGKSCEEEELGTETDDNPAALSDGATSALRDRQGVTLEGGAQRVDATKASDESSAINAANAVDAANTDHATDNANAVRMCAEARREKRLPGSASAKALSNKDAPVGTGADLAGKGKEKDEKSHTSKEEPNGEEGTTWPHESHYGKNVEEGADKLIDKNKQQDVAKEKNECLPLFGDVEVVGKFLQMDESTKDASRSNDKKKEEHGEVRSEVNVDAVRTDHTVTTAHEQGQLGEKSRTNHATTYNEKGKEEDLHQDKVQKKPLTGMKDWQQVDTTAVALNEDKKFSMEKKKKEEVQEDKSEKAKEGDNKKKANQRNDEDILGILHFDLFQQLPKAHRKEGHTGKETQDACAGEKERVVKCVAEEINRPCGNDKPREKLCDAPSSNSSVCTHSSVGKKKKKKKNVPTARSNKANTDKEELGICLLTNAKQQRSVDIEEKIPCEKSSHYLIVDTACPRPEKTFSRQKKEDSREEDEKKSQADQTSVNRNEKEREKLSMINDKPGGAGDEGANMSGSVNGSRDCVDDGQERPSKKTQNNQFDRNDTPPKYLDMQESAQRPTTKVMAEPSCHKKRKIMSAIPLHLEGAAHTSDLLLSGEIHEGNNGASSSGSSSGTPGDKGKRSTNESQVAEAMEMMDDPLVNGTSGKVFPNKHQIKNVVLSDENLIENDNEDHKADPFFDLPFSYDSHIIYQADERNDEDSTSYRQSLNPNAEIAFSLNGDDLFDVAEGDVEHKYARDDHGQNGKIFFEEVVEERGVDLLLREDTRGKQPTCLLEEMDVTAKEKCTMEGKEDNHQHHIEAHTSSTTLLDNTSYDLNPKYKNTHLFSELHELQTDENNLQQNPYESQENLMKLLNSKFEEYEGEAAVEKGNKIDTGRCDGEDDNRLCQSSATDQSVHRKYEPNLFNNLAQQNMEGELVQNYKNECSIAHGYTNVSTQSSHLMERSEQNPFCIGENANNDFVEYVLRNRLNVTLDSHFINENESLKKKDDLQINGFNFVEQIDALYQRRETNQNPTGCSDSSLVGSNGEVNHLHKGADPSSGDINHEAAKKEDTLLQNDQMRNIAHMNTSIMNVGQVDEGGKDDGSNCGDRSANQVDDGQPPADLPHTSEPCRDVIKDDCSQREDDPHSAATGDLPQRGAVIAGNRGICVEKEKQNGHAVVSSVTLPDGKDHGVSGEHTLRTLPGDGVSEFSVPCSKGKKITMQEDEGYATLDLEQINVLDDLTMCDKSGLIVCSSFAKPKGPEKTEQDQNSMSSRSSTDGKTEGGKLPLNKCTEEDDLAIANLDVPSGDLPSGSLFQFVTQGSSDGNLSEEQEDEDVGHKNDDPAAVHHKTGHSEVSANEPAREGEGSVPHPVSQLDEGSSLGSKKWGGVEREVTGGGASTLDVTTGEVSTREKVEDAELTFNGTSGESVPEKEAWGECISRESEQVPTLCVRNETEDPINGNATPEDNIPLKGKDEERKVSPLYANHRVEAEKLNQDIPYITNIHKEMHRSPVMPLRIEAFHSLEDQRLIYGRPEWQKYLCPLCDKAYYTPNSYMKNYTHYLNEHWKKRKIIGGYIIFPCKLIHNGLEEQEEDKEKSYLRISKKMKKKKKKKLFTDPHYHCPICINVHFTEYVVLTEHCVKLHKSSGADPSRTLPSDVVHTPFINSNDYYCALKKFESEKNIIIEAVNNCASSSGSTDDAPSAQLLVSNSTTTSASLEKGPTQSEQKNKGKNRRTSRVIFCDEIQVREYDIELSRIEKFGASIGPVFTEEKEQEATPSTVSEAGSALELTGQPEEGEQNGALQGEVEAKDGAPIEEDTAQEQDIKWAMDKDDPKDKPMKKCNKDISVNLEDIHVDGTSDQSGSANVKDSVDVARGESKKDQDPNTPVMGNTEKKIIERRKKKNQNENSNGSYTPNRKNLNGGNRKGVSNNLDETPLVNGERNETSGDHMDIHTEDGKGKNKCGGEEQPCEEENITSSLKNYQPEVIDGEKKVEQIVPQTKNAPSLNHVIKEENKTKDESGEKKIDEEHSTGASTNESVNPSGSVKVEADPPRSDSLNELISSLFSIDNNNNSPSSNSEHKSVPFSCLLYEENLQIKEQPLNEILLENRIENSKENIFIPVKKKVGKRMRNGTDNMHTQIISKYKRKIKICALNEQKKEGTSFFDFKNYENVYMPPKNVSLNLPAEKETHILKKVIRQKKKEKIPSLHINCRQSARIKNRNKLAQ